MASQTRLIYEFDDFQLEPGERKLMRRGELVPLHGKAFEMLLILIRNRGRLLTKDELFQLVWPDQIVEESNLTVNMSAIRRALGERASNPHYITTVSGRGYRFSGDVRQIADETLTVERERFARVTVEQEETESVTGIAVGVSHIAKAVRQFTSHPLLMTTIALVIVVSAGGLLLRNIFSKLAAPPPWSNVSLRRFAVHGGVPFRVTISSDGKSVAYVQRANGRFSLWLGQVETNSSTLIDDRTEIIYNAVTFAPDGQTIYITQTELATGATSLVRIPALGGLPTKVIANVNSVAAFSPNGRQLAFLRRQNDQTSIIVANSDGQNERVLAVRRPPQNFTGNGLSWSPDGESIVVATAGAANGQQQLMLFSVSDGSAKKFGDHNWGWIKNLTRNDDGLLLITSSSDVARRSEIWFVPYPAGEAHRITNDLNQYYGEAISVSSTGTLAVLSAQIESEVWVAPGGDGSKARLAFQGAPTLYEAVDGLAWTPDGHLLFSGYVGDALSICEAATDGTQRKQLTSNSGDIVDRQISVTADNRYVVFQSNRSGRFEIWRANRDGSNLKQLTDTGDNSQPSISPDSKWIVFQSERGGTLTLWRVKTEGGPAEQLTTTSSSRPEVSPDGKHIAYLGSSDSSSLFIGIMPFDGGPPEKIIPLTQKPRTNLAKRIQWAPDGKSILYKSSTEGIWRQRLDREAPEKMKGFDDDLVFQFSWSFDGKNLAYTRGMSIQDVVLLQDKR